jgi:hypothetical protein
MSGFAVITLAALLSIAWMVVRMSKLPGTARLSSATSSATTRPPGKNAVSDPSTGLSFALMPSPWRNGCPMRHYPVDWTGGEGAVAGHVVTGGHTLTWYANACSGPLPAQFQNLDLARSAAGAAAAIDTDLALHHRRTVTSSAASRVGGQPAWIVRFTVRYPGEHLAWSSADGGVVVVDRGHGRGRALFYVSVPGNLGTGTVSTLISSLR